ncbi:unnamed protein product [Pylaiella littoralis]
MTSSRAMKVAVLALVATTGSAFVIPTPQATSLSKGIGGVDKGSTTRAPTSRGDASAVAPLNTFSFSSITNFFNRDREGETSLPQDPKADQAQRKRQLDKKKKLYEWSTEGIPVGTPYLKGFPPNDEIPALPWITGVVGAALQIIVGTIRGSVGAGEIAEAISDPEEAKIFARRVGDIIAANFESNERPTDIEDYKDLHAFPVKTPDSVFDWEDDEAFARLRLQGANCVVLKKASQATRDKLKVLDSDPAYKNLRSKVDALLEEGKLFVVDHELLQGMKEQPVDGIPRYLTPCVALFEVVEDDLLPIRAIGIQACECYQGEEATPVFTPADGYNWQIAKACFESADFIIHEVVSHLGNTHVVLEAPMVAMNRCLPQEHPVHDLLSPHLEGTAFINWGAQELLIPVGAPVDRLMANEVEDSWDLVLAQVLKRISGDFSPEADFAAREITEKDFPGRYPYRDFGLRYWDATHTWVKEYLDIYYTSDKDIEDDYELQEFLTELVETAKVDWLKDFETTDDKKALLAKVIASWIYSASTLHAAVNFPQKPSMSFVPSCPGSVYAPPPTDKALRTKEDYLNYLPPMEIATLHVAVLTLLGSVFYTRLGQYEEDQFADDRMRAPLAKFKQALEEIEVDIVDSNAEVVVGWRNRGKDKKDAANFGYTTLLPDNIPQSTNI